MNSSPSAILPVASAAIRSVETSRDIPPSRPLLLRAMPLRLRSKLYYHCYRSRRHQWREIYREAPLHFAPAFRMALWPSDEGHSEIAFAGVYEIDLSRRIADLRREGGLMVDVGANYGYFSLLWAAGSAENRVIALEASPRNHAALQHNVSLNRLEEQIEVRGLAAGAEAGTLQFSVGTRDQTGWGGFTKSADETSVEVEVVRLDDVIGEDEIVNVLKIDVEGADTWVLYGAQRLLEQKQVRNIFFEENAVRMAALGIPQTAAREFLESVGYRVHQISGGTSALVEYHATPAS